MTRRRWIADTVSGHEACLVGDHADHLITVLRARVGQEFDVVANGVVRLGRISAISDGVVTFHLGEELHIGSVLPITVILSVFKFDRMEWAIEKCTELGIGTLIPVIAERTESHLASSAAKRLERWRRLAIQAAEQSRRTSVPQVQDVAKVREVITALSGKRILLAETESRVSLWRMLNSGEASSPVVLAIGPEGGWTNRELELFQRAGWISATLGNTILRVETAAIAAVAIAAAAMHEQSSSRNGAQDGNR
jgi:16S rRNA (uracil1498-N3)-methyltransferase